MSMDAITIRDCMDMRDKLGKVVIINAGHVTGFTKEGRD